jgi:type IV secretion system protein VirB9
MIPRSLFLSAMVLAVPAHADPRIATHFYQSSEVVTIHGRSDTQSTIAFAPDERIENIAVGDSASWQVTPNKRADLLFVKPMNEHARTNMTVVTDQRTYLFDLVNGPGAAAVYMLRFTYPDPPTRPAPAGTIVPAPAPDATADAKTEPAAPDPADLHFAWATHGDKALLPARLFDDGKSTYLAWPADALLPAILVREPGGTEGPVNYTVHGDFVVVEGVPAQLVLRSGKQMATLTAAPRSDAAPNSTKATTAAINTVSARPGSAYPIFASRQP